MHAMSLDKIQAGKLDEIRSTLEKSRGLRFEQEISISENVMCYIAVHFYLNIPALMPHM